MVMEFARRPWERRQPSYHASSGVRGCSSKVKLQWGMWKAIGGMAACTTAAIRGVLMGRGVGYLYKSGKAWHDYLLDYRALPTTNYFSLLDSFLRETLHCHAMPKPKPKLAAHRPTATSTSSPITYLRGFGATLHTRQCKLGRRRNGNTYNGRFA